MRLRSGESRLGECIALMDCHLSGHTEARFAFACHCVAVVFWQHCIASRSLASLDRSILARANPRSPTSRPAAPSPISSS